MTIRIDHQIAKDILYLEHKNSIDGLTDSLSEEWVDRIITLSQLCPPRKSATFIAAIGTAILAKSVEPNVDVYCLLDRDGSKSSYSARSLADNVWAKHRAVLGIDLGANGANPLNNTPFIGKARIDEIRNVRNGAGFNFLQNCLSRLATYTTTEEARSALRGFITARKRDFTSSFIVGASAGDHLVLPTLEAAIVALIAADSEDGRCAQAVAAGLLASNPATADIEVGHVNDPDRNFPLDIAIYQTDEEERKVVIAVEVKDKAIDGAEVLAGIEKALTFDISTVIYLAVSSRQREITFLAEYQRSRDMGCNLVVYTNWTDFIRTCVGFSTQPSPELYSNIYRLIGYYLAELGVSQVGIDIWKNFSGE